MTLGFLRGFFRRGRARRAVIGRLHLRIDRAARAPALFRRLGVPDTVEGRFEAITLLVVLVLRRLRELPPPAEDVAQDLVDAVFARFDASLRELGVGDLGVSKRMKKLAAAFYGRASGYGAALDAKDAEALARSLARNVLGLDEAAPAGALAAYVLAAQEGLAGLSLDDLLGDGPLFPAPDAFAPVGDSVAAEVRA